MKFTLNGPLKENIYNLMRRAGYYLQNREENKGESSFVRPPHSYPRFHIFLKQENDNLIFNLHLDQKRPIYKGAPAHAGEYEGGIVEKEAERVKEILSSPPSLSLGN